MSEKQNRNFTDKKWISEKNIFFLAPDTAQKVPCKISARSATLCWNNETKTFNDPPLRGGFQTTTFIYESWFEVRSIFYTTDSGRFRGTPPPWEHGTLTTPSSELREAFLIIFDFLKSSWFEVIARTKIIFFGSLGSVDLVLWSEKLAILLWCLSKEKKWLERHCTYSE